MSQIYVIEWGYQRTLNSLVQKSPHLTAFNFWSISCIVLWVTWNTHRKTQTGIDVKNNEKLTWLRNPDYWESNQNQSKSNKQNWETNDCATDTCFWIEPGIWTQLCGCPSDQQQQTVNIMWWVRLTLGKWPWGTQLTDEKVLII